MSKEFFLKSGSESRLIVIDDGDFFFWRHSVKGQHGFVSFSCSDGDPSLCPCPLCEAGVRRTLYHSVSVIDTTGYFGPGGHQKNFVSVFLMGVRDSRRFMDLRSKYHGLVGAVMDVSRSNVMASRLGDFWDVAYVDPDILKDPKVFYDDNGTLIPPKPYDYREMYKPKTAMEIRQLIPHMFPPEIAASVYHEKEVVDEHAGMIYNPISDTWSFGIL